MRKLNGILTAVILVLFLIHGIEGVFQMMGLRPASGFMKAIAWVMMGLIAIHTLIGIKYTADTIQVWRRTGTGYFRENKLFWARRISGFAIMLLLVFHVTAFGDNSGEAYRLAYFGMAKLGCQLLLVLSIAVHVISNVRPMLISFGIRSLKERVPDILTVLSLVLLFMAAGFVIYYLRWRLL